MSEKRGARRRQIVASALAWSGLIGVHGVLAACGPAGRESGAARSGRVSAGPVRMAYTFWSTESNRLMQERNIQLFTQKYPNITIEIIHNPSAYYDKLQTMFAGGTPPELFDMASDQFPSWVRRNTMRDLTDLIKRDQGKDLDLKDIWPRTIKHYEWQGRQWGIPRSTSTYAMYYNVDHFERAGVPLPTESWTWEQFLDTAKRLTKPDRSQWGYWYHAWQHWMWSAGGDVMAQEKDGRWRSMLADPRTIEAFQFLADLSHRHKVMPVNRDDTGGLDDMQAFMAGKLSMYDELVARVADHRREKLSFRWDVVALPKHRSSGRASFERPSCRAIAAPSRFYEEAWAFIKFVTASKEAQEQEARTALWIVPSIKYANSPAFLDPTQPPRNIKVFLDALSYARVNPPHPRWEEINRMLGQELRDLWNGSKSAREALASADQRLSGMLKEWGDHP
jgi:multiple sugar transport system substrate-binding protein